MPENDTNMNPMPKVDSPRSGESLLGDILGSQESQIDLLSDSFIGETEGTATKIPEGETAASPLSVKKPLKKPMSAGVFLRLVGAILIVSCIFFGAFLAYVVFNPGQASFFIALGINPGDITLWLRKLVRAIFGVTTFVLAIVWIIYMFRAILTKKEYKKKKTLSIIFAVFFGILFFSEMTLWAFLERQIDATDYENPNGGVVVYDNEKLISPRFKDDAKMNNFNNLIGPLTLKFDLKADAKIAGKVIDIDTYILDFDGAKCQGVESSQVTGVNPLTDQNIICTFDQAKVFKPTGRYEGLDRVTHKPKTIAIHLFPIQIVGTVDILSPKTYKDTAMTYDASRLSPLGNIHWLTEKNDDLVSVGTTPVFSLTMKEQDQVLCLNVFGGTVCDKLFIIPKISESSVTGRIMHEQNREDPLSFTFYLKDQVVKNGEITGYKWVIDTVTVSTSETCTYSFSEYKDVKVTLFLNDSAGNITELRDDFSLTRPLKLVKTSSFPSLLKITDTSGKSLIDGTYDTSLRAYHVMNVVATTPVYVLLNATDVKVENYGYELTDVEWDINNDGVFEKTGNILKYELIEEKRYTFQVRYIFTNKEKNLTSTLEEKIIFESTRKDVTLNMNLTKDSEYAPTTIHVDGSASIPKSGTIAKFMYDFGEGKGSIEGDAIQDYHYNYPGEYIITFTVVRDDGTKEQSSRKIILKDIPKMIVINTSVSTGIVGKPIDFDTMGSRGQIETYKWDFGDGGTSAEPTPTHIYQGKGKYTVKITVTYTDRTMKSTDREIEVKE